MRAIMVMFDTLNRRFLPNYGGMEAVAPNFARLGEHTVTFDKSYVGSMPCMPARRELHTGRLNFLHRSWGPIEPFDDSMPEILRRAGIHSHLVSDHQHYWEDGGGTYHSRYSTWESVRGQEGDKWKANLSPEIRDTASFGGFGGGFTDDFHHQDAVNRSYIKEEKDFPQYKTFEGGLEFLETNHGYDNWFLQLETFDPHEPFFSASEYEALYPKGEYDGPEDWPPYGPCNEGGELVDHIRRKYLALLSMCDRNLGRVLDLMDRHDMWKDTMLIVNTDHGYLLGEHQWWSKSIMPLYDEICHTPLFIWDPRCGRKNERSDALVQTIDLAPTLLDYFGLEIPKDMQGRPLKDTIAHDAKVRDYALFGYFGGHVNITDGRHVYMHAPKDADNSPLYDYTLMPCHMRNLFSPIETATAVMHGGFSFTKGSGVMKIDAAAGSQQFSSWHRYGDRLYDLETDPRQEQLLQDNDKHLELTHALLRLMRENEAPAEQYERLGLTADGAVTADDLQMRKEQMEAVFVPEKLKDTAFSPAAAEQLRVLLGLSKEKSADTVRSLRDYFGGRNQKAVDTEDMERYVSDCYPAESRAGLLQLLQLAGRKD